MKRLENASLTLLVNYRKILQKKNYAIQNNNKLAIWYMSMRLFYRAPLVATSLYTHYLFRLD